MSGRPPQWAADNHPMENDPNKQGRITDILLSAARVIAAGGGN